MYRPAVLPDKGGCSYRENDGEEARPCADFIRLEDPRGYPARAKSLCGTANQETQDQRKRLKAASVPKALRKDGGSHPDGRRQARADREGLCRSFLPCASS